MLRIVRNTTPIVVALAFFVVVTWNPRLAEAVSLVMIAPLIILVAAVGIGSITAIREQFRHAILWALVVGGVPVVSLSLFSMVAPSLYLRHDELVGDISLALLRAIPAYAIGDWLGWDLTLGLSSSHTTDAALAIGQVKVGALTVALFSVAGSLVAWIVLSVRRRGAPEVG